MSRENPWIGLINALADYGDHGDGDLNLESFEAASIQAGLDGLDVISRRPDELLLDIDDNHSLSQLEFMCEKFPSLVRSAEVWESKGGNHHARVELWHDIESMEALLLQACFGSDPVREFLCFLRLQNGIPEPSRLFTPKDRKPREVFP